MHYQTSSAEEPPESGTTGMGTLRPEAAAAALWLAGDEADFSTAVDTHLMYFVSDSGLFAWSGLSSGFAMNFFRTSGSASSPIAIAIRTALRPQGSFISACNPPAKSSVG